MMSNCLFYQPFQSGVERFVNAGRNGALAAAAGPVRSFQPRLDLHEDTEKNLVTATFEFPGVSKDDVQLDFQNGKLTVSAETKKSEEHTDAGYTSRQSHYGTFSRTLQLPQGVQDEQIKATMENGLLTVTYPKTLPEHAPKEIAISDS